MLVLLTGVAPGESLSAAIALRGSLDSPLPVAVVDGAGLQAGSPGLSRHALRDLMEGVVDAHERLGAHAVVATVPAAWAEEPEVLAFFLRRRHAQRVMLVTLGGFVAGPNAGVDLRPWSPEPPRITSERLELTTPSEAQLADYYHAIRGTSMFDTLCWDGPESLDEMLDGLLKIRRNLAKGAGHPASLGIIERATGRQVGGVSFRPQDADDARGDIGYTIAPAFQRRGFGTEAVGAIVRYAFEQRRCRRIEAEVFVGNEPSRRLLEHLGFRLEGTRRQQHLKRGRLIDEWFFALTRDRWTG